MSRSSPSKDQNGTTTRKQKTTQEIPTKPQKESDVKTIVEHSDILLPFEAGFIEPEVNERIYKITQDQIVEAVDIQTSEKVFDLDLETFGPYSIDYSRNGKYLLLAGEKGHVAMIDWGKKELMSENHFKETIHDIKFLHSHQMFAVAQKKYAYIYDEHGVELHRLSYQHPKFLDYLPYHFLLVLANEDGFISYLDASIGRNVTTRSARARTHCLAQNPNNAIMLMGQGNGCVTMWAPNTAKPVVSMLCHQSPVRCLAVDSSGQYLVTAGLDNYARVWDMRNTYKHLLTFETAYTAKSIAISQRGILALSFNDSIHFWKNMGMDGAAESQYIRHKVPGRTIRDVAYCPFEDVFGIGHSGGFSSILVPGSGEPNFDSSEVNPYQTKSQRRNAEVKMLLDKIPSDMILLDSSVIGKIAQRPKEEAKDLSAAALKRSLIKKKKKTSLGATPGRAFSNSARVIVDRRRVSMQEKLNKDFRKEMRKKRKAEVDPLLAMTIVKADTKGKKKKKEKETKDVHEMPVSSDPLSRFKRQKK